MVEKGAGLYLENEDTNPENLYRLIKTLADNPEQLKSIQNSAQNLAKFDGTEKIAQLVKDCI